MRNLLKRALMAFVLLACAPVMACAAVAYPQFPGPSGSNVPPGMTALVGTDTVTGLPCLIGISSTSCALPGLTFSGNVTSSAPSASVGSTSPTTRSPMSYKDTGTGQEDPAIGDGTGLYAKIVNSTLAVTQSGAWSVTCGNCSGGGAGGAVTQSGAWNVGLTGVLPGFAATPTFNLGSLNGAAQDATVAAVSASVVAAQAQAHGDAGTGGTAHADQTSALAQLTAAAASLTQAVTQLQAIAASEATTAANTGNTNAVPVTIASGQSLGVTSLPGTPAQTADVAGVTSAVQASQAALVAKSNAVANTPLAAANQTLSTATVGTADIITTPGAGESVLKVTIGALASGATIEAYGSTDGGQTYPFALTPFGTTTPIISAAGGYTYSAKAFDHIEFVDVAAAAGTATIKGNFSVAPGDVALVGMLPGFVTPPAVLTAGTTGLSYGANKPTLPNVGANFAASGPYASYVLVATVPALSTRSSVDIENSSGSQIVVVRDDGTAASGAAPANASVFPLAGGSGVGSQGGAWTSQTFKGRLQIYAPSTVTNPQIAAMVE